MARIKPQALLIQSKKKKGPTKISLRTIITCNLVIILAVLSLYATYKNWYRRSYELFGADIHKFEDLETIEGNKNDVPGYAILNTSKGSITIELNRDGSPVVVDKFLDFCQKGYFKGMAFHHVIKNFVIQGGDIHGLGAVDDWTAKSKWQGVHPTGSKHEAFMIGTKAKQESNDFQLFITTAPIPNLSDKIIVFGRVIKGEDVVQEIEEVDTDEHYRPKSPIGILDITLTHEV